MQKGALALISHISLAEPITKAKHLLRSRLVIWLIIVLSTSCSPAVPNKSNSNEALTFVAPIGSPPVDSIVWSPLGNKMLVTAGDVGEGRAQVYVVDLVTDQRQMLANTEYGNFSSPTWAPDGKQVLVFAGEHTLGSGTVGLWILDPEKSSPEYLLDSSIAAWSPNGDSVATFATGNHDVNSGKVLNLVNVKNKTVENIYENQMMKYAFGISWSPDGQNLVFTLGQSDPGNIYIINIQTKQTNQITQNIMGSDVAWSPRGDIIAYTSWPSHGSKTSLHLIDTKGECDIAIPNLEYVWSPTWSPDGEKLGFIGKDGVYYLEVNKVLGRNIYQNLCQ